MRDNNPSQPSPPPELEMVEPPTGPDNYEVGPAIAQGGMGSILSAQDRKLKRDVAIKVMILEADADDSMRRRFLREAEVLAKLSHPNIVPIYDIVWEHGLPLFYSMKLVKGRTLQAILNALRKEDPTSLRDFSLDRLLLIFRKICDAIAFAHSKGVLHRDLKPENIMVGEFGEVLVMDWGLAKILGEEQLETGAASVSPVEPEMGRTLDGAVMGTPQFMSPEQAMGLVKTLDERSDIYSLGAILYALLTLRPPVEGKTAQEILSKVSSGEVTSPSALHSTSGTKHPPHDKGEVLAAKKIKPLPHTPGGRIPAALSSVVMKALQREKGDRYQNIGALNDDVEAFQGGFATSAEQAGTFTQIRLLLGRHKIVSTTLAALLFISIGFILKLIASEQIATEHAMNAEAQARRATASAQESQRSLAKAQISIAEAAFRRSDLAGMVGALEETPPDLRAQDWDYLSAKRNSSLGPLEVEGFTHPTDHCPLPNHPGQFALSNREGRIGIIDVAQGTLLRTIDTGDPGNVHFSISGDGKRLFSYTKGSSHAHLFDFSSGVELSRFPVSNGEPYRINRFSYTSLNHSGSLAGISGTVAKQFHVFDSATGEVIFQGAGAFSQLLFHPNKDLLYVLQPLARMMEIYDLSKGAKIITLKIYPQSMSLSPDGKEMALGLYTGEVVIVDAMTGRESRRSQLHTNVVSAIAWTAGGNLLTMGGEGGFGSKAKALRLWEPQSFGPRGTFFGVAATMPYMGASLNRASGHLLTRQSPPQLWHFPDRPLSRSEHSSEQGWSCNFVSDTVLLARKEFEMTRYDVSNPREPIQRPPVYATWHTVSTAHPSTGLFAIAKCIPSGKEIPSTVSLRKLSPEGAKELWNVTLTQAILALDFDAKAERLLLVPVPTGLHILDGATGEPRVKYEHKVDLAVFAGRQGHIAALERPRHEEEESIDRLLLIDPADGAIKSSLSSSSHLNALAVSPDRQLLAIAGDDQFVTILDANTLEERHRFRAHDAAITALKFHPSKPLLATGAMDFTIKIWDYQSGQIQQTIHGLGGRPVAITISPNGELLAVDGMEKAFRIYKLDPQNGRDKIGHEPNQSRKEGGHPGEHAPFTGLLQGNENEAYGRDKPPRGKGTSPRPFPHYRSLVHAEHSTILPLWVNAVRDGTRP